MEIKFFPDQGEKGGVSQGMKKKDRSRHPERFIIHLLRTPEKFTLSRKERGYIKRETSRLITGGSN